MKEAGASPWQQPKPTGEHPDRISHLHEGRQQHDEWRSRLQERQTQRDPGEGVADDGNRFQFSDHGSNRTGDLLHVGAGATGVTGKGRDDHSNPASAGRSASGTSCAGRPPQP
jgi:hypothetical protein